MLRFTNMSFSEIEDEARSKHIAKLDFFKTVRASVEEVGLSSLLIFHHIQRALNYSDNK